MPRSRRISLGSSILLLASCGGDSTQPSNPPDPNELPPLESVDYDRLGRGKLAFQRVTFGTASSQGYYVVDADARTSTSSLGGEAISAPALSPDGRRVTYTQAVDVATGLDVFVSNLDGTSKQRVANFAGHEGPPTWTPDGSQIVFLGRETQGGDESSVYRQSPVANPSDRTRVAVATIFVAGSPPCTLVNVVDDGFIAVSSEGRFAFSCASSGVYDLAVSCAR